MNRDFGEKLITCYAQNKRHLPWRNTQDPYKIWLSEIILQQTKVNQGITYYYRFTEAYPDCEICIFRNSCFAKSAHRQADFPVKKPGAPVGQRYYYYFVIRIVRKGERYFCLNRRTSSDIWRNLFDFPAIETSTAWNH